MYSISKRTNYTNILNENLYTGLCIFFVTLIIIGNLTYQKFVSLEIPMIHKFELSVGAILYPFTFFITDLITEFYGKEKANFCIKFSIFMNIIIFMIISLMDYLPAVSWSKIDDNIFHQVFGFYFIAFMGSLLACYISQSIDILLYLLIKKITKGKYLWLRNNLSTSIALLIDTMIVVTFLTIFNVLSYDNMWKLIWNSYSWKLFITILSTPLFYLSFYIINLYFTSTRRILDKKTQKQ